jgi:soluble lytic murein transglycosylase-like protein
MMARRLLALLAVAAAGGGGAALAGSTTAATASAARLPALPTAARQGRDCPLPRQYRPAFEAAARDTNLPLALLVAVGQVESNLRQHARSHTGAHGLLQVMPATAADLGLDETQAESNVLAGARYLRLLMRRFDSADLALAAYNAGPTSIEAFGGARRQETLTYVANVTSRWRELHGCR